METVRRRIIARVETKDVKGGEMVIEPFYKVFVEYEAGGGLWLEAEFDYFEDADYFVKLSAEHPDWDLIKRIEASEEEVAAWKK